MRECPEKDYDMSLKRNNNTHQEQIGEQRHVQQVPQVVQRLEEPPPIIGKIPFRDANQRHCSMEMDMSSYIYVTINGERVKALIDTGGEMNMISADLVFENQVDQEQQRILKGIGGKCRSVGTTAISIDIGDLKLKTEFNMMLPEQIGEFKCLLG